MNILIAEDNELYGKMLKNFFSPFANRIEINAHVAHTIDDLQSDNWDYLFVDINLIDGKGYDILEALKEMDYPIEVYLMSGNDIEDLLNHHSESYNIRGILKKPFSQNDLNLILTDQELEIEDQKKSEPQDQEKVNALSKSVFDFCQQIGIKTGLQLVQMFSESLSNEIPKLSFYLERGQVREIESIVHQVKSNSRYFGLDSLGSKCEQIETLARENDTSSLVGHLKEVESQLSVYLKVLEVSIVALKAQSKDENNKQEIS